MTTPSLHSESAGRRPCAVRLRAMEPEDLDMLYRIENDRELWDMGATNVPYSRYALHEYMASSTGDIYADRQVRLVIENEAGETVGLADLTNFDPKHLRAEIGLVIEKARRRRGYASAAIVQLHRYARETLRLHQVYAVISAANTSTLSIFRRHGYEESARLRQWIFDGKGYADAIVMQNILQ